MWRKKIITVGMFTARDSYSMLGYPELHIFEYLLDSLNQQTFKNFELVICDLLYEQRKDYFKEHPQKFKVKHVSVKPNIWTPRGCYAISTSRNTCILHAETDYIILIGDCVALSPQLLENAMLLLKESDYLYTACQNKHGDEFWDYSMNPSSLLGYGHTGLTASLKLLEEINGYDEGYDGCKGYEDGDIAWRLGHYGAKVAFNRGLMYHQMHKASTVINKVLRCPAIWGPIVLERAKKLSKWNANSIPLTDEEFDAFCGRCRHIDENDKCEAYKDSKGEKTVCRFNGEVDKRDNPDYQLYRHPSLTFNLKEQRRDIKKALKELELLCQK